MRKSTVAFQMSAERLMAQGPVYFWTFTFRDVFGSDAAFDLWDNFMRALKRRYPSFCGLRVVECHSGSRVWEWEVDGSHGLHFHLLVDKWMSVDVVREAASRWGFGRVHVRPANSDGVNYLSKYLSKRDDGVEPGRRRWAAIGKWAFTRVRDVIIDSALTRNIASIGRGQKLPFAQFELIRRITRCWGEFVEWPSNYKRSATQFAGCDKGLRKLRENLGRRYSRAYRVKQ